MHQASGDFPSADQLAAYWPIEPPLTFTPLVGGTNSHVWRVEDSRHSDYVLRIIRATAQTRAVYAISVMRQLAAAALPFRLPVPLTASTGETLLPWQDEQGVSHLISLTPFLAGSDLDPHTAASARIGGSVLAQLDRALATITLPTPDAITPYGDLAHCHPLIPDPMSALQYLPGSPAECEQMQRLLAQVIEQVPWLYRSLPQQIIHGDFSPGNFLLAGGQISAILDFDLVGPDLRVLDLVVALSWWPIKAFATGNEWPILEALGRAYVDNMMLTQDELVAIPQLMRLRDVTSFMHRFGRYLAGQETPARIQERIRHSLWREEWLTNHAERLQTLAVSWLA